MPRNRAARKAAKGPPPDYSMYPKTPRIAKKPKAESNKGIRLSEEEEDEVLRAVLSENPIVVAIMGQCLVEYELDNLLRYNLKKITDSGWNLLTNHDGPLGTFSRKIKMAFALKLITSQTRNNLERIRVIRNQFAHSHKIIDFSNDKIFFELMASSPTKDVEKWFKELRFIQSNSIGIEAYQMLCQSVAAVILKRHTKGLVTSATNMKRAANRKAQTNPFQFNPISPTVLSVLLGAPPGQYSKGPNPQPLAKGPLGLLAKYLPSEEE